MKKTTLLVVILVAGLVLAGCAAQPTTRTITVSGQGEAEGVPDIAYISLGVQTRDPSVSRAVNANSPKVQAVLAAVKQLGVEEKDIQTGGFNVYFQERFDENGFPTGDGTYFVSNTVNVTVRNIKILGDVLGEAVKAGANSINGVTFAVEDPSGLYAQAREEAVLDARANADAMAKALGLTLGKVISIAESGTTPILYSVSEKALGGYGGGAVPVQEGTYTADFSVVIVFELN